MAPSRQFRLNTKNIFLTYPLCSLSKDETLFQILNIRTTPKLKYVKICRELHQNGEPHIHALLQFEARIQVTNKRLFDLVSPTRSIHFHPNILGARSSSDVKKYLDKDGDILEWGEFQIDARSARGGQQSANEAYAAALNSGSKSTALDVIRELAPKDFVLQYHNLNSNLERIFMPPIETYASPFSTSSFDNVPAEIEEWAAENVMHPTARPWRPISIVIEGQSRTGKTMWARSLGPKFANC